MDSETPFPGPQLEEVWWLDPLEYMRWLEREGHPLKEEGFPAAHPSCPKVDRVRFYPS